MGALSADHTREVSLVPYSFDGEIVNGVTLDFNYASVTVVIGKTKQVDILTEIIGEPKEGYRVVDVVITPMTVDISGEINQVESVQSISTEAIQLNGDEDNSFILDAKLVLPDGIKTSGVNGNLARVEIFIEEVQTKEFTFEVKDIPVVNLSDAFETDLLNNLGVITVKVTDIESVISQLTASDIRLDFNFGSVTEAGSYRMNVNFADESLYSEVQIEPAYVDVSVTLKGN